MKKLFALSLTLLFTATTVATSVMAQNMSFSSIRGVSPKTGVGVTGGVDYIGPNFTNGQQFYWSTEDTCSYFASDVVAIPYTPQFRERMKELHAVFTTYGQSINFSLFTWQIDVWSSLNAFTGGQPEGVSQNWPGAPVETTMDQGDVASWPLAAPDYGSLTQSIGWSGPGNPNYLIGFNIPQTVNAVLNPSQTYYISLRAKISSNAPGQTGSGGGISQANMDGPVGVQAFDYVDWGVGSGWLYTYNYGGSTWPNNTPAYKIVTNICAPTGNC